MGFDECAYLFNSELLHGLNGCGVGQLCLSRALSMFHTEGNSLLLHILGLKIVSESIDYRSFA